MCQLEKPRANEITEPLAFTVCKPELRGKVIVLQSRSRRTRLIVVNYGHNETKATSFVGTRTNQVPLRGFKEAHVLAVVNKGQNEGEKTYFHKTKTNRGESAAA